VSSIYLSHLRCPVPPHSKEQGESYLWLQQAYSRYQKTQVSTLDGYAKLLKRVGCPPDQISRRYFYLPDFNNRPLEDCEIFKADHAGGALARQNFFQKISTNIFEDLYETDPLPSQLIHVTCTGYVSPSGAQLVAAKKSPSTMVTHSYHMGCYGAFPALRMAAGFLDSTVLPPQTRESVDIVHTELCTLQLSPEDPTLEQIVIQTLFADGVAAYRLTKDRPAAPSLELLHSGEFLIPNSEAAMAWVVADGGMKMTLSKDVPAIVGQALHQALLDWEKQTGTPILSELSRTIVAVHPGGPKIIDAVKNLLELEEDQVRYSREVLFERGNMSSATVPHIWKKILENPTVPDGTPVLSMAFGPGLTLCLSLMKVRR
jgi:predicted naringenin-chalcone synthase